MNVIIVHGIPGDEERASNEKTRTYDKHWIGWLKKLLPQKSIQIETPLMPEPWSPKYSE